MRHALCLCVADQVHLSPPSPGSLGHVPVCRRTRLGHGVVSHAWHSPGDPVHRSGLPSRHGWPALCQQSVHRSWTGSAVGCGQSDVQQQVPVEHQPVEYRKSSVRICVWLNAAVNESLFGLWRAVQAPSPPWPTVWPKTKASSGIWNGVLQGAGSPPTLAQRYVVIRAITRFNLELIKYWNVSKSHRLLSCQDWVFWQWPAPLVWSPFTACPTPKLCAPARGKLMAARMQVF